MEALDVCSKPKRARSQNFSIMEMDVIHNELKANPVLESKFSNIITNQKKQSIWLDITEKVNAFGNTKRTINEVMDKFRNMCRDAKEKICRASERDKKDRRGPTAYTPITVGYRHCGYVQRLQLFYGNSWRNEDPNLQCDIE